MTPRERWAVAWRTARVLDICPVEVAAVGAANASGRQTKRVPLASVNRSAGWFSVLALSDARSQRSREEWLALLRENLRLSRKGREHWERLP